MWGKLICEFLRKTTVTRIIELIEISLKLESTGQSTDRRASRRKGWEPTWIYVYSRISCNEVMKV